MKSSINPARIHNVSRIYRTAKDAANAVGISAAHFRRLCVHYGIEPPSQRRRRERAEAVQ